MEPHWPFTHWFAQHSLAAVHAVPAGEQGPAPQSWLVHLPLQHWDAWVQMVPSVSHAGPAAHFPRTHMFEQQPASAVQVCPLAVHPLLPQTELLQAWLQQSMNTVQPSPSGWQATPLLDELLEVDDPVDELVELVELLEVVLPPVPPVPLPELLLAWLDEPVVTKG